MYIREQAVGASLGKEKFSALEWPVKNRTACNRYLLKVGLCKLGGTARDGRTPGSEGEDEPVFKPEL